MKRFAMLLFVAVAAACGSGASFAGTDPAAQDAAPPQAAAPATNNDANGQPAPEHRDDPRFVALRQKITYGRATMAEVREALTDPDIGALTNTVLALYSMRWHRGVYNLLHRMWDGNSKDFEELQWEQFAKAPVRLALATTLLRIELTDNGQYVDYLREHRYDKHEFHRAQVVIGLGFKGETQDLPYITDMAAGDNAFVAQSAITALGLMERPQAYQALRELLQRFEKDPRAPVIRDVIHYAYEQPGKPRPAPALKQAPEPAPAQEPAAPTPG